jgi:MraZ protein
MNGEKQRTAFVGKFTHTVDDKKRVSVPAKWRAAASGSSEFYVLPDPKNHLVVYPQAVMDKVLAKADEISIGEYGRRDVLRSIASKAHSTPCDKTGRIMLTDELIVHAGIKGEAVLVGVLNKFEIWSPERLAEAERAAASQNFAEAAKELGL